MVLVCRGCDGFAFYYVSVLCYMLRDFGVSCGYYFVWMFVLCFTIAGKMLFCVVNCLLGLGFGDSAFLGLLFRLGLLHTFALWGLVWLMCFVML